MQRWFARMVICLMLGAVTTIALAWTCALWSPVNPSTSLLILIDDNDETWMGGRLAGFGIARFTVFGSPGVTEVGRSGAGRFPRWLDQPEELPLEERVVFGMEAGWPLPALVSWRTGRGDHSPGPGGVMRSGLGPQRVIWIDWSRAIEIKDDPTGSLFLRTARVLPFGIRPLAFAIDCVIFAALWLGPFLCRDMGRWRRRRRGCCPQCGYDLRGGAMGPAGSRASPVGCPECGWNRNDDQPPGKAGG